MLLSDATPLNLSQDIFLLNWGGKRRNEKMFQELASSAGLSVKGAYRDEKSDCGVIELIPVE